MALDKMAALEARIRSMVELIQSLKKANASLESELRAARERLAKQDEMNRRWEEERADVRSRIEKVLGELEILECVESAPCEE
ncbi:MAG: cell division protein ZapB [Nitrospirota bacterium]|nr:cell division protein ZapB [Nitrospirota bacterium]MDE3224499.1 cell division protein ZapB [Nitrospirota bacterium]MDE3242028.1 cell division protein ZapB [Nitrospirota bacterium]